MDASWIAVAGSSVAAVGSAAAAVITSWSARQQTTKQISGQEQQWRREKRREAYANFLESGARARDELLVISELAQSDDSDFGPLAERVAAARALTDNVRGFGARVLVEGPAAMERPTRRVEEDIAGFRRWLEALITARRSGALGIDLGRTGRVYVVEAGQVIDYLRYDMRRNLDLFAAAARLALDDISATESSSGQERAPDQDLQWLLDQLEECGADRAAIDVTRPIKDIGDISSLHLFVVLTEARSVYALEDRWTLSELYESTVEQLAAYLAARRPT
ncbi:hypothetical protein DFR70_12180 [Nocardia tenerifensis]|uniref:Uncharacterized protein n=1 Tax=Nocardia tenerifensis TaxID=228006 RepID=A0A318JNR0_9NOCA|nr:hypothetical protein [Nocardia tenerifensis]PXX55611.1 hypothetical protein DFR70_12180 [Nocardia tenerifensis]